MTPSTVEVLAVAVPVGVIKLHEAETAFDETAGDGAVLKAQEGQFLLLWQPSSRSPLSLLQIFFETKSDIPLPEM